MVMTVKGIAVQGVAGEMAGSTTQPLRSKPEGGGDNRTVQVQGVAGAWETINEAQTASSDMQVDPGIRRVIDGAEQRPINMGPDTEADDSAVGGSAEPAPQIAMVARDDQRIA